MPKIVKKGASEEKSEQKPTNEQKVQVKEKPSAEQVKQEEQVKKEEKPSEQKAQVKVEGAPATVEEVSSIVEDRLKELGALWISDPIQCEYDKNMSFRITIMPNKRRKKPPAIIALVRASEKTGYISALVPLSPNAFRAIEKMYREACVHYDRVLKEAQVRQKELEARRLISSLDKETLAILKQILSQM